MEQRTRTGSILQKIICGIGIAAAIVLFFKFALPWFMPFLLALVIARLLEPLIDILSRKIKLRRQILSALSVLLSFITLGGVLYYIVSYVFAELWDFFEHLPEYIKILSDILATFRQKLAELSEFLPESAADTLVSLWDQVFQNITISETQLQTLLGKLTDAAVSLPSVLMFVITLLVSTFLISADYEKVARFLLLQIPDKWQERFIRTKTHLTNTLWKWLKALFILLCITFAELTAGFLFLGVKHAVFFAFLISLVDMLPILGVGSVLIPWAIYELFLGNQYRAIFLAVLYGIISLVRNICEPKIIGSQIGLHPLVTLLCVYIGYKTLGLTGMLLFPIGAITVLKFQEWGYIRLFQLPEK